MTVMTLTTVGFREVHEPVDEPLSRLWTMLLAVAGVGIIFGSIGIVAETIMSEAASGRREAKRMREAVAALRGHYIVCGYGRVGLDGRARAGAHRASASSSSTSSGRRSSARRATAISSSRATRRTTRRCAMAGIEHARGLVTTIDSDANNVFVTLSARAMNPSPVHRRAGQRRGVRGEARAGRRQPDRVALHDGRPADRGAREPAARRRLHRRRAVAREPLVLAGGGRGRRRQPAARA